MLESHTWRYFFVHVDHLVYECSRFFFYCFPYCYYASIKITNLPLLLFYSSWYCKICIGYNNNCPSITWVSNFIKKWMKENVNYIFLISIDQEARRAMKIHRLYQISNRFKGKYKGKKGETIIPTQHCDEVNRWLCLYNTIRPRISARHHKYVDFTPFNSILNAVISKAELSNQNFLYTWNFLYVPFLVFILWIFDWFERSDF